MSRCQGRAGFPLPLSGKGCEGTSSWLHWLRAGGAGSPWHRAGQASDCCHLVAAGLGGPCDSTVCLSHIPNDILAYSRSLFLGLWSDAISSGLMGHTSHLPGLAKHPARWKWELETPTPPILLLGALRLAMGMHPILPGGRQFWWGIPPSPPRPAHREPGALYRTQTHLPRLPSTHHCFWLLGHAIRSSLGALCLHCLA